MALRSRQYTPNAVPLIEWRDVVDTETGWVSPVAFRRDGEAAWSEDPAEMVPLWVSMRAAGQAYAKAASILIPAMGVTEGGQSVFEAASAAVIVGDCMAIAIPAVPEAEWSAIVQAIHQQAPDELAAGKLYVGYVGGA